MAKFIYTNGQTSARFRIKINDTASTSNGGKTGLTSASSGLIISTIADTEASATVYTAAGSTIETITTLGTYATPTATKIRFKEVDATNHPGWYEVQIADARLAVSGAKYLGVTISGATAAAQCDFEIQLSAANLNDAVRLGLTALPNANAAAASGLPVLGTNATAISFTGGMTISNASGDGLALSSGGSNGHGLSAAGNGSGSGIKGTGGATGRGIYALGGATSGAGIRAEAAAGASHGLHALGFTSGHGIQAVGGDTGNACNLVGGATSGLGITITTTSGDGISILPTAGHAIVATANGTSKHGFVITGGTAGTSDGLKAVAGTGGVAIRGGITGDLTGNVSGSVGSVTGAVGSVTGAVGSVTGSVGSVTATVTLASGTHTGAVIPTVTTVTNQLTAAAIATGVWQDATAGDFTAANSIGKSLYTGGVVPGGTNGLFIAGTNAATTVTTAFTTTFTGSLTGSVASVSGNVGGNVAGTLNGFTAAALAQFFTLDTTKTYADAVAGSVVFEVVDNAGGGGGPSAADIADAVWSEGMLTYTTAGTAGNLLLLAGGAPGAATIAGAVWDVTLSSHLTSGTTGAGLNAAGSAGDPWATSLPGAYGSGTAGKIVGDNINATVSSRSTYAGGDTSGTTTLLSRLSSGRATLLDNLDAAISTRSTYAGGDTSGTTTLLSRLSGGRATLLDNLDAAVTTRMATFSYTTPPTAAAVAVAVVDQALSGHTTSGTVGGALNAAGDPWTIALPGSYGSGTAGNILGNNLNATVSSRLATTSYTAAPTAATNAATLLDLSMSGHTTSGTVGGALNAAGSSGDPWGTGLPGEYADGTAGAILGDLASLQPLTPQSLNLDESGRVKLQPSGLDDVAIPELTGVAETYPEMQTQLWRRFFCLATQDGSHIRTYADDGVTVITTQQISDTGTLQTQGRAT